MCRERVRAVFAHECLWWCHATRWLLLPGVLLLPVGGYAAGESALGKATQQAISELALYLGDLSAVQALPPDQREQWLNTQAAERVRKKSAEAAQQAILTAAKKHAEACIKAKAFETVAAPAARSALALGLPVDWTRLHADSAAAAAQNINLLNSAITSAKVTWNTVSAFRSKGMLSGFQTFSGEVAEIFAKAYIPGYSWVKVASKVVVAGGNYIMETVREDSAARAIELIYGQPLAALSPHIQFTSAAELTAQIEREWSENEINVLLRYPGSSSESGAEAMKQRVIGHVMAVKREFDRREALQRAFEDEIAAAAASLRDEVRDSAEALEAASQEASKAGEPYLRIIEEFSKKFSHFLAEESAEALQAREQDYQALASQVIEVVPRVDRAPYLSAVTQFLQKYGGAPPADFDFATMMAEQDALVGNLPPYPQTVGIERADWLAAFEQGRLLWNNLRAEGAAEQWVSENNGFVRDLEREHEEAYRVYEEAISAYEAAADDLWTAGLVSIWWTEDYWLDPLKAEVQHESTYVVAAVYDQAEGLRQLLARDKNRGQELQAARRAAVQSLRGKLESILSRFEAKIPAGCRTSTDGGGHLSLAYGHPLGPPGASLVVNLVTHDQVWPLSEGALTAPYLDYDRALAQLAKIMADTVYARDFEDKRHYAAVAANLLEEVFSPYRRPLHPTDEQRAYFDGLPTPNWRLVPSQWELSLFLDRLEDLSHSLQRTFAFVQRNRGLLTPEHAAMVDAALSTIEAESYYRLQDELRQRLAEARETVPERMAPYWDNLLAYESLPPHRYESACSELAESLQTIEFWANGARRGLSPELVTALDDLIRLQTAYARRIAQIRQWQSDYRVAAGVEGPRLKSNQSEVVARKGVSFSAAPVSVEGSSGEYSSPNLPPGVSLAPHTGLLEGVPTGGGYHEVVINFTDAAHQTTGGVVTLRIGDPDLILSGRAFPDALPTASADWVEVPWLGFVLESQAPWVFHGAMGWFYPNGDLSAGDWLWQYVVPRDGGWMFTRAEVDPYLYSFETESWVFRYPGAEYPGYFNILKTGEWVTSP